MATKRERRERRGGDIVSLQIKLKYDGGKERGKYRRRKPHKFQKYRAQRTERDDGFRSRKSFFTFPLSLPALSPLSPKSICSSSPYFVPGNWPKKGREGGSGQEFTLIILYSFLTLMTPPGRGRGGGYVLLRVVVKKTSSPTPFLLTANSKKHSTFAQRFAKLVFWEISQNGNFTGHRQNSALP